MDGGLRVQRQRPRPHARLAPGQRHQHHHLVLHVLVHARPVLQAVEELPGRRLARQARPLLVGAARGAAQDAARRRLADDPDAGAAPRRPLLLVGLDGDAARDSAPLQGLLRRFGHLLRHLHRQAASHRGRHGHFGDVAHLRHGDRIEGSHGRHRQDQMSPAPGKVPPPRHVELKVGAELVKVGPEHGDVVSDGGRHLGVGAAAEVQLGFSTGEEQARERGLREEAGGAGGLGVGLVAAAPDVLSRGEVDLRGVLGGPVEHRVRPRDVGDEADAVEVLRLQPGLGAPAADLGDPDGPAEEGAEADGHPQDLAAALHHAAVDVQKVLLAAHDDDLLLSLMHTV